MRNPLRVTAAFVLAFAVTAGCGDVPPPDVERTGPPARLAGTPSYDAGQEPASAVLSLVPETATT
ncbi:MAG: hypothetical protein JWN22_3692, partial [Nocardioides sp.]|nr:hypothetical protein [Nocardioides sp.]